MTRYRIDSRRSRVVIDATSSVHPIHSEAQGLEGWLDFAIDADGRVDASGATNAHVEFPVTLLKSGNPLEDRELYRRIEGRRFPTIGGDLTSLQSDDGGTYRVVGNVTFKGVTLAREGAVAIAVDADGTLRVQGSSTFDVRDFGMQPPRILLLRVHPEVKVTIDVVALEETTPYRPSR